MKITLTIETPSGKKLVVEKITDGILLKYDRRPVMDILFDDVQHVGVRAIAEAAPEIEDWRREGRGQ